MISNLEALIAPLSVPEFKGYLRRREPLLMRGAGAHRYETLIDWPRLLSAIGSGEYPVRLLRLTRRGDRLPFMFFREGDKPNMKAIEGAMAVGGSLIAYNIGAYIPPLRRLCGAISEAMAENVHTSVTVTTGEGGALKLHFDTADIIALQIEGRKRWIIQAEPVVDPVFGLPDLGPPPDAPSLMDVTLEPGDFLYVPAGYRHRCENQCERSLHLVFGLDPLTAPRALDLIFRRMVQEVDDRKPIRFDAADAAAVEAALKQRLSERIMRTSLADLIAEHRTTSLKPTMRPEDD